MQKFRSLITPLLCLSLEGCGGSRWGWHCLRAAVPALGAAQTSLRTASPARSSGREWPQSSEGSGPAHLSNVTALPAVPAAGHTANGKALGTAQPALVPLVPVPFTPSQETLHTTQILISAFPCLLPLVSLRKKQGFVFGLCYLWSFLGGAAETILNALKYLWIFTALSVSSRGGETGYGTRGKISSSLIHT